MSYDVDMRHQQALDPSALNSLAGALHAVGAAITDCRNAGKDPEADPAVILLVRHLSAVCAAKPADFVLRRACMDQIAEIRRHPVLKTLAYRGVAYDEAAKRTFHREARVAMRALADALALPDGSFDIRSNKAGAAVSGEITLHAEDVWVCLSLGPYGPDKEILNRKVRGRDDHVGGRNHWASVRDLLQPDRFAQRLRRDLGLAPAAAEKTRLFA